MYVDLIARSATYIDAIEETRFLSIKGRSPTNTIHTFCH